MIRKNDFLIFLVEDDEKTVETIKFVLEREGFKVFVARDGEEAVKKLEEGKIEPDLILLDLVLPIKNGFETLKILHQKKIKIPIIVLSNLGQDAEIEKALSLEAKDYLVKSRLSLKEILEKVKEGLN